MFKLPTKICLGKPNIHRKCSSRKPAYIGCNTVCRCIANQSAENFQYLKLRYHHPNYFLPSSENVSPNSHIIYMGKSASLISSFEGQKRKLALSGDGRADSPGHSAKYGSYTVLEMTCNKVVDYRLVQVSTKQYLTLICDSSVNSNWQVCFDVKLALFAYSQSNEVGGSYHMEKEGLNRVLKISKGARFDSWSACHWSSQANQRMATREPSWNYPLLWRQACCKGYDISLVPRPSRGARGGERRPGIHCMRMRNDFRIIYRKSVRTPISTTCWQVKRSMSKEYGMTSWPLH